MTITPIGTPDWGTHTAQVRQTTVDVSTAIHIGPGGDTVIGVPLTRTGYAVFIDALNFTGVVNAIPMTVDVQWLDSGGPAEYGRQVWSFYAGKAANAHNIVGTGPVESGTMQLTITNHHGTDTCSFTVNVADVSQPYRVHDWHTEDAVPVIIPGFTQVTSNVNGGIIARLKNVVVAADTSPVFLLPLYSGLVYFSASDSPSEGVNAQIISEADQVLTAGDIIHMEALTASVFAFTVPLILPRSQCAVQLNNYSGANTTMQVGITAVPQ